ncbi:DHS-like NAD/FAD-binding domain-containing protein [Calocera cornea HHB12733]|uniref:DHS-like NAD/FAD-binding domain-containing protein n=1 Tax=Calocera cornea HHB12733 TaxID=1353952 RepID=A0A165GBR2_9BASI|nr:DHS-like NAD/FAD-binding domain-containing protein [Calocera cornea HHB12733]
MTVTLDLAHLIASTAPEDAPARRSLSALSLAVARARRVIVVTGAGISCSSGIPDFRSSDGLYSLVKARYPSVVLKGRDLFDASLFRSPDSTALFYTFMAELKAAIDAAQPSRTHEFLKALDGRGKLLRSYTQNIDGLEQRVGISTVSAAPGPGQSKEEDKENVVPPSSSLSSRTSTSTGEGKPKPKPASKGKGKGLKSAKNVQLHGDIHAVRCTLCAYTAPFSPSHTAAFREGEAPPCPACSERCEARLARAARSIPTGTLRPAIVLYDEPHPLGDEIGQVQSADMARAPDLMIVMGTSLKVHGLKRLVRDFAGAVHARPSPSTSHTASTSSTATAKRAKQPAMLGKVVFVNRTPPGAEWAGVIDYHVQGETDAWVARVEEEWRRLRPQDWEVQTTLDALPAGGKESKGIKVTKPALGVQGTDKPLLKKQEKRPKARRGAANGYSSDAENVPLSQSSALSGSTLVPSPTKNQRESKPSASALSPSKKREPLAPLSPSKRQNLANHYDSDGDGDVSPRKRRSPETGGKDAAATPLGERRSLAAKGEGFPEKGLLFGSPAKGAKQGLGLDELSLVTPTKARRVTRSRAVVVRA